MIEDDKAAQPDLELPTPLHHNDATGPTLQVLSGSQRQYLRGLAHGKKPVVMVGHDGATKGVLRAIETALHDHELIKVRLQQPPDKRALSAALSTGSQSTLCGLVGHTAILYRPHPDRPHVRLPRANGARRKVAATKP